MEKAKDKNAGGSVPMRGRIFNCLQYEINPKTGVPLNFSESNIIACVQHKTITRYAYIKHDKDTITEADIETGKGMYTESDLNKPKGVHWHIVIETANNAMPVATIAKWLGIPENMVDVPKGRGAFIDCVEYLRHSDIHQALKGKYEYEVDEVKANFNWQAEVEALVLRKTEFERPLSEKEYVKNCVLYKGMTLGEVIEKYPTLYQEELATFQKLRLEYINRCAPLPPFRVNFYIYGGTGSGKDTMAHAIAKALFQDREYDDDIYFEVGAKKVSMDGYDGQPVIIWSEFRSQTFVETLGGYEEVLGAIDIIPKNKRQHKKFGSVKLINCVNIVTSTQDYKDFLRGLIDDNDPDPTQAHRRFPIIIPIHANYFEILLNSGYLGDPAFSEYQAWRQVKGSFGTLARTLNQRPALFQKSTEMLTGQILEAHKQIEGAIAADPYEGMTDDEVLNLFLEKGYGEYQDAEEIQRAAEEKFLDDMQQYNEERFDALLAFGHWFWDESPKVMSMAYMNGVISPAATDDLVEQLKRLRNISWDDLKMHMEAFSDLKLIQDYPEYLIREVLEMTWTGQL